MFRVVTISTGEERTTRTAVEAVQTAFRLIGEGLNAVIVDAEGKTWMASQFARFLTWQAELDANGT